MTLRGLILFITCFNFLNVQSQNFSISGTLKDVTNGETVIGATIFLKGSNKATFSNNYGFYSLSAPAGKDTLVL
ncbi:MAG: carboxypeptidase-like regulatory domain-containing protein, partial [Bacteroidia bacterium]|nr:carboxypeptidase-like regulatory domain-containing protein [Bacteroidia bacterium]